MTVDEMIVALQALSAQGDGGLPFLMREWDHGPGDRVFEASKLKTLSAGRHNPASVVCFFSSYQLPREPFGPRLHPINSAPCDGREIVIVKESGASYKGRFLHTTTGPNGVDLERNGGTWVDLDGKYLDVQFDRVYGWRVLPTP